MVGADVADSRPRPTGPSIRDLGLPQAVGEARAWGQIDQVVAVRLVITSNCAGRMKAATSIAKSLHDSTICAVYVMRRGK